MDNNITGHVFDIQRFALHDGPGIRTTVFFKGCANRCGWCHNPESFSREAQLQFYPLRCVSCGKCAGVCPNGAHEFIDGAHRFIRAKCDLCGRCTECCYAGAIVMNGREVTIGEVLREVMEDAPYYKNSGGGVTLSGGEPVLQNEFALGLLKAFRDNGLHTNIQTAGNYPFEMLKNLIPYLDMVMYDIKAISEKIYEGHIRGSRGSMLENIFLLDEAAIPIIVRTPVIAGVNDDEDEIISIAKYIKPLKNLLHYALIPYHGLGRAKYDALGMDYINEYKTPPEDAMTALENAAARFVTVYNNREGIIGAAN